MKKGNSAVNIDGGGGQDTYLYNVKIGDFSEILMSSLKVLYSPRSCNSSSSSFSLSWSFSPSLAHGSSSSSASSVVNQGKKLWI